MPADVVVMRVQRIGLDLLDALAVAGHLIVVDALATGVEPGTCTIVDATMVPATVVGMSCAHRSHVREIVDLARQAFCDEPSYVTLAGIERKVSGACGADFSDEVMAAVPCLVDGLLLAIGARISTRAMVKEVCGSCLSTLGDAPRCGPTARRTGAAAGLLH